MKKYIGLDVHCKQTVFVAQDSEGKVIKKGKVKTTPEGIAELLESVGAKEGTKVGLESGTQATWMSRLLSAAGMKPVVIEAREVRTKARRRAQKSDSRDAFEICDGLRRGIYSSIVYVPSEEVERLRAVLSRRRFFVRECTRNVNAAKFILRSAGLGRFATSLATWHGWQKLLARPEVEELRDLLLLHARAWRFFKALLKRLEVKLAAAMEPFAAEAELLQTAPGVGPIVSATFIAAVADPERFPSSKHLSSYLGLVPSSYDSSGIERRGRITKSGPAHVRAVLCEAAHCAARTNNPLNAYWRRISNKGGYRKAVVAVSHRMARILWAMWRKGEAFDEGQLNVEFWPKRVARNYFYRLKPVVCANCGQ